MTRIFPQSFKNMWSRGYVKLALVSDNQPTNPYDCQNCGGVGSMELFLGAEGPYQSPSAGKDRVSKFYDGAWWIGKNHEDICPVCKGAGRVTEYKDAKPIPIELVRDGMADAMAGFEAKEQAMREQLRHQRRAHVRTTA